MKSRVLFRKLLNRSGSMNPLNVGAALTELSVDNTLLTIIEICKRIRQTRDGEAPEPNRIPDEALKSGMEATL